MKIRYNSYSKDRDAEFATNRHLRILPKALLDVPMCSSVGVKQWGERERKVQTEKIRNRTVCKDKK